MVAWGAFAAAAPYIAGTFQRRHAATGNLCLMATLRADGSPRVSPIEPRIFEDRLVLVGMPGTLKFRDLGRDPRFSLHTATVDPHLGDGDAKVWGVVENVSDVGVHERFAEYLFEDSGLDLRGEQLDPFYVGDIAGGSAIDLEGDKLKITIWKAGEPERVVYKT